MHSSRWLWRSVAGVSVAAAALFVTGFAYALHSVLVPAPSAVQEFPREFPRTGQPAGDEGIHLVTLGDSLTKGYGDPEGKGYAGRLKEMFESGTDRPVYWLPFAVNGYETEELLRDLREQKGIAAAVQKADIVLLTIGANDLFDMGEEVKIENAQDKIAGTLRRIDAIFAELAKLNPDADVFYAGLYNPFAELEAGEEASRFVQEFNQEVLRLSLAYESVTFVPMFDLFVRHTNAYLSSDGFHPNGEGYRRMAERIAPLLETPETAGAEKSGDPDETGEGR